MLFIRILWCVCITALLVAAACAPARRTVSPLTPTPAPDSAALFTYGKDTVTAGEFRYVYEKNNADSMLSPAAREKALRDYLNLYINFRLKVKAAEDAGMARQESFRQELEQYRQQLAKPYLVENRVTEQLIQEVYDRLQQEVRAAHILIAVDENATPADTLAAYRQADSLRRAAISGASFAMLAEQYSDDPSAASNGGDLGYFTALQMVYPFEDAAFETAPDSVSRPVRTSFGYHIIKVKDKRPSRGKVKVAHLLVRPEPGEQEGEASPAYRKAMEIYQELQNGADWGEMVSRFSDDVSTRASAGELPYFGTGQMMESFEQAAFALQNPGDLSRPVKTRFGWHLIKLTDRQPLPPLEELRPTLERSMARSDRSAILMDDMIDRLKQENGFQPDEKNMAAAVGSLYRKNPEMPAPPPGATLFSIRGKPFRAGDFYVFARQQQKQQADSTAAWQLYRQYETQQIMRDEENHLADKYEDYRRLLKEYRDGILLFDIMEQKVWTEASEDSVGLRRFFEAHRNDYRWGERAEATILDAQDEETLSRVQKEIQPLTPPLPEEKIASLEKRFNTANPLALQIHQGMYEKGSERTGAEAVMDEVPWKKGTHRASYNGRAFAVIVHEVLSPRLKDLKEVKGIVIADYQTELDKQWIASLRQQYPVEIYENVLQQLVGAPAAP